jgi:hypothetical protein
MKKLELSIPKPCHEDWNTMMPEEKGRFCASCRKTVVDFSRMSDRQLLDYFKQPKGSVCGHFSHTQLNREIEVPKKRLPWIRYFFTISLPAFLLSMKAGAQGDARIRGRINVNIKPDKINACEEPVMKSSESKVIKGRVVDEKGAPIPFASIMVESTGRGTVTAKEGTFELSHQGEENAVVAISSVGFESRKVTIAELDKSGSLVLVPPSTRLMGEIVVVGLVAPKKSKPIPLIQPHKMDTAFAKFAVYPNPVLTNSSLTIDAKGLEAGNYLLQLVASNGEVVQSRELVIDKKRKRITSNLAPIATGPYFLRLTNQKNNKSYTEIIMVQ